MTDYSKAADVPVERVTGFAMNTFPSPGDSTLVQLNFPEFSSLCPVSRRPDVGRVIITYEPDELILETKSLRDYLYEWREKQCWQEHITRFIAEDIMEACAPLWLTVEIEWSPRGGIFSKTTCELSKE